MKCLFIIKLIILATLFSENIFAQSAIKVHVINKKSHIPIIKAHVELLKKDRKIKRLDTDTNGFVKFEAIDTGFYNVRAKYVGYCTFTLMEIKIQPDMTTRVELEMTTKSDHRKNRKVTYCFP